MEFQYGRVPTLEEAMAQLNTGNSVRIMNDAQENRDVSEIDVVNHSINTNESVVAEIEVSERTGAKRTKRRVFIYAGPTKTNMPIE